MSQNNGLHSTTALSPQVIERLQYASVYVINLFILSGSRHGFLIKSLTFAINPLSFVFSPETFYISAETKETEQIWLPRVCIGNLENGKMGKNYLRNFVLLFKEAKFRSERMCTLLSGIALRNCSYRKQIHGVCILKVKKRQISLCIPTIISARAF